MKSRHRVARCIRPSPPHLIRTQAGAITRTVPIRKPDASKASHAALPLLENLDDNKDKPAPSAGISNKDGPHAEVSRTCGGGGVLFFSLRPGTGARPSQSWKGPDFQRGRSQAGMKGYAWTVLKGSEPEPLPVEILGIYKNQWGPKQDVILAKARRQGPAHQRGGRHERQSGIHRRQTGRAPSPCASAPSRPTLCAASRQLS